jgi:hypothetical protein
MFMKKTLVCIIMLGAACAANAELQPTLSANIGKITSKGSSDSLYWDASVGAKHGRFIFEAGYLDAGKKVSTKYDSNDAALIGKGFFLPFNRVVAWIYPGNEETATARHETAIVSYNQETAVVPYNQETAIVPYNQETSVVPYNQETSIVPYNQETAVVPYNQETSIVPINQETSIVPYNQETAVVPYNQETSIVPYNQETTTAGDHGGNSHENMRRNTRAVNADTTVEANMKKKTTVTNKISGPKIATGYALPVNQTMDVNFKVGLNWLNNKEVVTTEISRGSDAKEISNETFNTRKLIPSFGVGTSHKLNKSLNLDPGLNCLFLSSFSNQRMKYNNAVNYTLGFTYKI